MNELEIIDLDNLDLGPIERGKGMIAYRKYLWAIKKLNDKLEKLEEYKAQVLGDIEAALQSKQNQVDFLRNEIKAAMLEDPAVDNSPTGGKTLSLPDIATVSLSKETEKVILDDSEALKNTLGKEFQVIKVTLDATKAKHYLEGLKELPEGAHKEPSRTLTIKFK